jgi:CheY-like chemotaxis protein
MLLEDMLMALGYEVVSVAARVDEAMQAVERDVFDLAILDLNLDGQPTFPVAARLAERGRPFIFATGYGRSGVTGPFEDVPVLQKPFLQGQLAAALGALAERFGS